MKDDSKSSMDRREFLAAGLTTAALLPGALLSARTARAEGDLVTDVDANEPMVAALQYTHESEKPDQNCGNCQLYTAGEGDVGKCQLFATGNVMEGGWCMSWAQKVT